MLSPESRAVIEATLPVVGEHIQAITQRFYERLFTSHPELLDGTFNRGNQVAGAQQQALAASVAAFAGSLISDTPLPQKLLSRIAHKHASLGVQPEQYQVVYDHLMLAIVDVLGAAVTPPVAEAWSEVYWLMANTLVNQERGLYSARGVRATTVWREWAVEKKIRETPDVMTFVFKRIDSRLVKTSLPGQFVTVLVPMPDGVRQPRQFSLTRADDGQHRQISVKRVHGGDGRPDGEVSTMMVEEIQVGDVLTMSLPYGDVVLDDSGRPVVFVSAGIGITPMAGMLSHLAAAGSDLEIMMLHADEREGTVALRRQVVTDVLSLPNASLHVWYEDGGGSNEPVDGAYAGRMNLDDVTLPENAWYYLCGPISFMAHVRETLLARGVFAGDIQYEVFGPDLWQADLD